MVSMSYFVKCIFLIIVLWFLVIGLMSFLPSSRESNGGGLEDYLPSSRALRSSDSSEVLKRIDNALKEIHILKKNNAEMKRLLSGDNSKNVAPISDEAKGEDWNNPNSPGLSPAYEKSRRLLELDLKEMWNSVRAKSANIGEADMEQIEDIYK